MARRTMSGPADQLLDIVAKLPWWAGVLLALVSYLLLHRAAAQLVTATMQPGQVGAMVAQTFWKALAGIGQYHYCPVKSRTNSTG